MNRLTFMALLAALTGCAGDSRPAAGGPPRPLAITTAQFRALAWLEGRWRGTLHDTGAFYEGYRFADDSTLVTYTFADSLAAQPNDSGTIRLRGDSVITGEGANHYVATALDSASVTFEPRGSLRNAFTWRRDADGWTATLHWRDQAGRPVQRVYVMRRATPR